MQSKGGMGSSAMKKSTFDSMRLGSDLGTIGYNLFGDYTNPGDAASGYLGQIQSQISPYYQPYINSGLGAMGSLEDQYKQLLSDPTAIMNMIGSNFQASPGYQYNVDQATSAANQAAAAGGMAGSPAEQAALANQVSGMASQDYNNYMKEGLGLYNTGLDVAGGINQMGYNASNQMAQSLVQMLLAQAKAAAMSAKSSNAQSGGMFGAVGDAMSIF